jgi:hypothetical protein
MVFQFSSLFSLNYHLSIFVQMTCPKTIRDVRSWGQKHQLTTTKATTKIHNFEYLRSMLINHIIWVVLWSSACHIDSSSCLKFICKSKYNEILVTSPSLKNNFKETKTNHKLTILDKFYLTMQKKTHIIRVAMEYVIKSYMTLLPQPYFQ